MKLGNLLKWIGMIAAISVLAVATYSYFFQTAPLNDAPKIAPADSLTTLRFAPGAPQLAYLKIESAKTFPVPLVEALNGRIAYDDNVTARLFSPVAGRLLKLPVQAGDSVRLDQPLAFLEVPDYADLRRAEADLRAKRAAYERAKVLFESEVIAKKDFESAENDLRAAEAEQGRAEARLRNLRPVPGQPGFALRAPLAGIVTERQANPGMEVRPDQSSPIFVVSDPTRLWAFAELSEKDLAAVRSGQTVAIVVDAYPGRQFIGKVLAVGDVLDPQTRRVPVRCEVANPDRLLKPEMFARIIPETEGKKLPRVPNTALVTAGVHSYLFVEKEPGVIEKREVELAFRGHETSFVANGIGEGDRVVTTGALLLDAELGGN